MKIAILQEVWNPMIQTGTLGILNEHLEYDLSKPAHPIASLAQIAEEHRWNTYLATKDPNQKWIQIFIRTLS